MAEVIVYYPERERGLRDPGYVEGGIVGELVRCKDCKHRDPEDRKCDCGHDIQWQLPREDNWFCADGERK